MATFLRDMRGLATGRSVGQGLVEFALVIPVFLIILMGLLDVGRLVYAYNTISEAARNGARVALVNQTPTDIRSVAAGRAVALGINPATDVTVTFDNSSCDGSLKINCSRASVTVRTSWRAITPIFGIVGSIQLSAESRVLVERLCPPTNTGEPSCPLP